MLFAVGAVTGTILSSESGILWPMFMERFGEVIVASAWFVVTANAWMNQPTGFRMEGGQVVAVFLTADAEREGHRDLAEGFRHRALLSGVVVVRALLVSLLIGALLVVPSLLALLVLFQRSPSARAEPEDVTPQLPLRPDSRERP